ncbi:MAG: outer membrane beta-barrel protein [Rubrivivax sp.]
MGSTGLVAAEDAINNGLGVDWNGAYAGLFTSGSWTSVSPAGDGFESGETHGWGGGAYAGYNTDLNGIVFGVESDIGKASGEATGVEGEDGIYSATIDWTAHLRGRVGVSVQQALFYLAGGAAIAGATLDTTAGSSQATYLGWTVGAGVDFAVTQNAVLRLEYLHDNFGTATFDDDGTDQDVDLVSDTVRAGFSFKF